jgi:hypothetical protein
MSTKTNSGTNVPNAQTAQTKNVTAVTDTAAAPKVDEKKSITDLQKELAKRLQELSYKKKLADNREKFLQADKNLSDFQKELTNEDKAGIFDAQSAKIVFQSLKNGYRGDDLFAISNVTMILKFIAFLRSEILEKIKEIEAELVF